MSVTISGEEGSRNREGAGLALSDSVIVDFGKVVTTQTASLAARAVRVTCSDGCSGDFKRRQDYNVRVWGSITRT